VNDQSPAGESPFRDRPPVGEDLALEALRDGELEILGRMPWSSNATFLVDVHHEEVELQGVYKPGRGERPLWDFPDGLFRREAAAYELSSAMGWDLVPPTVVRDGPLGEGSVQLFIPCDFDEHYFHILEDPSRHHTLQRLCAFDVVVNSTDRKGGHCLLDHHGSIWAIDNGLTFHAEFKLRTVIWEWAGDEIPDDIVEDLVKLFETGAPESVGEILRADECEALAFRTRSLVETRRFPTDPSGRRFPWPLI
jgi:uncharacterized repeat protein (TIGR03843 family)